MPFFNTAMSQVVGILPRGKGGTPSSFFRHGHCHDSWYPFVAWASATLLLNWLSRNIPEIVQYIPRIMHAVFALLCFVVVIHWLIFPYPSGFLHWHCGNLTIAPVPAKQPWWIWINTSCEFIMNDCITTTKQSTTKPCAYFLGYTVVSEVFTEWRRVYFFFDLWFTSGNKPQKISTYENLHLYQYT